MYYRDLFQCLKGTGTMDLSSLAFPLAETSYMVCPVNCSPERIDQATVRMLTDARNANADSFLTFFKATPERTYRWLSDSVGKDGSRILFVIKRIEDNNLYGYMGLAYGDSAGERIEGDAIVRFQDKKEPGLMRRAFMHLVRWAKEDVGINEVWLRVLSDNPAIEFYKRCGFTVDSTVPLYEVRNRTGQLEALQEAAVTDNLVASRSSLTYLQYRPAVGILAPQL